MKLWPDQNGSLSREAIRRYIERRQADLVDCHRGLLRSDFSAAERVGHNLKGNGVTFGFPELSELGGELERVALSRDQAATENCLLVLAGWVGKNQDQAKADKD